MFSTSVGDALFLFTRCPLLLLFPQLGVFISLFAIASASKPVSVALRLRCLNWCLGRLVPVPTCLCSRFIAVFLLPRVQRTIAL